MWMMVLFDLPVLEPAERKAATRFRLFLKDLGFQMTQFSVYVRHTAGREAVDAYMRKIRAAFPGSGKVDVLLFTDKQYADIVSFRGVGDDENPEMPKQLALF